MEGEILKIAMSQGIWAVLSIFLIIYILKIQEKRDIIQDEREKNYCKIIEGLTDKISIINSIDCNIKELKKKFEKYT